jgi:ATP-dependent protease ClpP protease subunit
MNDNYSVWTDCKDRVWFDGEVCRKSITDLIQISYAPLLEKRFYLVITSEGGDVDEFLRFHDFINSFDGMKIGHALGYCMSCGLRMLTLFDKRYTTPNCIFMAHELSYTLDGKKPFEIRREMIVVENILGRLNYKAKCNNPNLDAYYDSEEALKLGIINEIKYL